MRIKSDYSDSSIEVHKVIAMKDMITSAKKEILKDSYYYIVAIDIIYDQPPYVIRVWNDLPLTTKTFLGSVDSDEGKKNLILQSEYRDNRINEILND